MSELKVDRIEPALANKITLSPSVFFENATGLVKFLVDSTSVTLTGPLKLGTTIGLETAGTSRQILTSQGPSLPPIWTDNFPIGGIIMWSGSFTSVPKGWTVCNGGTVNGITTPNLTDKFVIGIGQIAMYPQQTGGTKDAVVVAHTHGGVVSDSGMKIQSDGSKNWWQGRYGTTDSTGESGYNKNLPPYMGLYYIMRVS
jgi:hypothetical protein